MRVTIKDIAKEAGVSITTVSRVINNKTEGVGEETRERILKIIDEKGYTPNYIARGLVLKKTQVVGVIIPDIMNPFFPEIIRGVEDTAAKHGYNIILCNTDSKWDKEKEYIKLLIDKYVDGIIYTGSMQSDRENIEELMDSSIPFVFLDRFVHVDGASYVCDDGVAGMYEMVSYLIEEGHRNIAYISGARESSTARDRLEGYKKALIDHGIPFNPELVVHGDYKMSSGKLGMGELLKLPYQFTAVACANDLMAVGALDTLHEKGIEVPKEISITGYDDIYLAGMTYPKLTTMAQAKYSLGVQAMKLLVELMDGKSTGAEEIVLRPRLVVRDSVERRRI